MDENGWWSAVAAQCHTCFYHYFMIHSALRAFHFIFDKLRRLLMLAASLDNLVNSIGSRCKKRIQIRRQKIIFIRYCVADSMGLTSFHTKFSWKLVESWRILPTEFHQWFLNGINRRAAAWCVIYVMKLTQSSIEANKWILWRWWCVTESVSVARYLHSENVQSKISIIWIVNRSNLCKQE